MPGFVDVGFIEQCHLGVCELPCRVSSSVQVGFHRVHVTLHYAHARRQPAPVRLSHSPTKGADTALVVVVVPAAATAAVITLLLLHVLVIKGRQTPQLLLILAGCRGGGGRGRRGVPVAAGARAGLRLRGGRSARQGTLGAAQGALAGAGPVFVRTGRATPFATADLKLHLLLLVEVLLLFVVGALNSSVPFVIRG